LFSIALNCFFILTKKSWKNIKTYTCKWRLMAQSQCRRSVGDKFWPGVVVENKESLNNRNNNPYKSGAVTLSEIFLKDFDQVLSKNRGIASEAIEDDIWERLFFYPPPLVMWGKRWVFWPRSSVFLPVHCSVVSRIWLYIEQSIQLCREAGDYFADIESQPEFAIPHSILRLVSDYSDDTSD